MAESTAQTRSTTLTTLLWGVGVMLGAIGSVAAVVSYTPEFRLQNSMAALGMCLAAAAFQTAYLLRSEWWFRWHMVPLLLLSSASALNAAQTIRFTLVVT